MTELKVGDLVTISLEGKSVLKVHDHFDLARIVATNDRGLHTLKRLAGRRFACGSDETDYDKSFVSLIPKQDAMMLEGFDTYGDD